MSGAPYSQFARANLCSAVRPLTDSGICTFSCVGGLSESVIGELEAEGLGAFGVVDHFPAQQGDEVKAGRPMGLASPPGQSLISLAPFGAEGLERGQEQSAVGGHHQDRLFGYGVDIPQLGLSDAQGILLVAVVDFDLPAVEVDLQQLGGGVLQIGGEQIGRLAVVEFAAFAFAIGGSSDDEEAERDLAGAAAPIDLRHLLVTDTAALASVEQLGLLPGVGLVPTDLFGGKGGEGVKAPGRWGSAKTEPCIRLT